MAHSKHLLRSSITALAAGLLMAAGWINTASAQWEPTKPVEFV
ncbi:MAG: tripartite tricarboxylate transporter substrate binding protein, partial [Betaproteobacteria bacterium]|nr:tripartite tricarboxylate transporter substrate binding protein [Betaproteobacteria bacterium]